MPSVCELSYLDDILERKNILQSLFSKPFEITKHVFKMKFNSDFEEYLYHKALSYILEDYIEELDRELGMNKVEKYLSNIIDDITDSFKFTGKRSKNNQIGSKYPDFTDQTNKRIIELHGDYWHNLPGQPYHRTEQGTIEYYEAYGYKVLVIWECELKEESKVITKIKEFIEV